MSRIFEEQSIALDFLRHEFGVLANPEDCPEYWDILIDRARDQIERSDDY